MKKLIIIYLIFFCAGITSYSKERYIYSQISQKEGLTSSINCICKEKDGDVWIGSPRGLYSFNGYSLKHYDTPIFKSSKVFQTIIDSRGNLWVLTNKCITIKYTGTDSFVKLPLPKSHPDGPFYSMVEGKDCAWIGGVSRIYKYTYNNKELSLFCEPPEAFDCRTMCLLDENTILTCSRNGKMLIDTHSGAFSNASFGDTREIAATLIDSKERVWMAFYNNGIQVFSKDGKEIQSYNTQNSALSNDIVLCFAEWDGKILAGTDGGGINIINPETDEIHILSHISGNSYSFPAHSIKSIYVDQYNNIWAGSIRDGLIQIGLSEIHTYQDTYIGLTNGLSNPTVLCLYQDPESDNIWVGTDGEGLNRFDSETNRFEHYESTLKTKIVSIASFSENELALSVYSDNILIFNKNTGTIRSLDINDEHILYMLRYTGRSVNLYNENDGTLLLISNTIHRYNSTTGQCIEATMSDRQKTHGNFLVIGSSEEGVWFHDNHNIYLLKTGGAHPEFKGAHPKHMIMSGHLDESSKTIWLATEEGLCRYSITENSFSHINSSLYPTATSVVCDRNSRVWIGTEKGLFAYMVKTGIFTLFGESDGVTPNEFLPKPHLLTRDGDIYLGGVNGLLHIESTYTIDTSEEPSIRLNELYVDGNEVALKNGAAYEAAPGSKMLSLSISTLEKDIFRHKAYRFYISGGKVYETTSPTLELTQLPPPGKYDIQVSCTKRNGEWTEPVKVMTLRIPTPWYLSWWFISICCLLGTLTLISVMVARSRKRAQKLKMAMKEQKQKIYEEKVSMLINVSHELRTPLTLIMAPLKRLLKDGDVESEQYFTLTRVYRQSRRMRNLLDMVLDLRKKEVKGDSLKLETLDFNQWVEESIKDIADEEKVVGINITCDFDPSVKTAAVDRQKCDIVLMNILINAIKHSAQGDTITIRTRLTEHGSVRTSISDQGPGLGKDIDLDKMFTRFYQSNCEQYGSGIGLSYSKILVEMHGGRIGVENNPDKGATFWWEIPVATQAADLTQEPRAYINELLGHSSEADLPEYKEESFSTSNMKIMLVDDSQDLLDFLKESLCQDFTEIITATGGKQAMRLLSEGKIPDIIVSDLNMPDGDGFWLCNELKQNEKYSHIPTILLTARGEDQSQSLSYKLGADAFMAKPFEIETLMELVRNMLRGKAEIRKKYLDTDAASEADYGSKEERFILQLNKIIAEHISDPDLDQQFICMEMGVSRALLYNKMKAITGAGAKEYITKIRIEKAKSLIETTPLTIAEISDMTGFASQSYFSTAFKNYTGMTPSQYKQTSKANKNETV